MTKLLIKGFSCIKLAEVELSHMTILIGPQASGKSVISKLMFFFLDRMDDVVGFNFEFEEMSVDGFTLKIIEEFKRQFPPQAWGPNAFQISFTYGSFSIALSRAKPRGASPGRLKAELSQSFISVYEGIQSDYNLARRKVGEVTQDRKAATDWDIVWKLRQSAIAKMKDSLRNEFVSTQLFIPAGRSFFSSMGKAVVAFEHMGSLDPLTIQFGKIFVSMRDVYGLQHFGLGSAKLEKQLKEKTETRVRLTEELFSGQIKIEKGEGFIESSDGRKTPFSIMSSGQQELLPLWLTINEFVSLDHDNILVYIEEPEAHLFPSAQGKLIEYICSLLADSQRIFITTHSPYILSKLNNLMKAGYLGASVARKRLSSIEAIIPKEAWIKPGMVAAYAIVDGNTISIVGDDGLLDGEYLDSISGDILSEFNSLLEIQYT